MSESDPADASRSSLRYVLVTTAVRFILWGVVLLDLAVFVPRLARVFRDFNMRLPEYSAWAFTLSDWTVAHPGLVPAAFLALLLLDVGVLALLWRGAADVCQLWSGLLTLAALIVAGGVLVCSLLPLVKLLHGLSR